MASELKLQAGDPPAGPQGLCASYSDVSPPASSSLQQRFMEKLRKMWQALSAVRGRALTGLSTRQVAAIAVINLLAAFLVVLVPVLVLYHINGPSGRERVTAANDPFLRIMAGPQMQVGHPRA